MIKRYPWRFWQDKIITDKAAATMNRSIQLTLVIFFALAIPLLLMDTYQPTGDILDLFNLGVSVLNSL